MTRYTICDGNLVLTLATAEEGGYGVTCPLDPELITQAESIEEAFANARGAAPGTQTVAREAAAPPRSGGSRKLVLMSRRKLEQHLRRHGTTPASSSGR